MSVNMRILISKLGVVSNTLFTKHLFATNTTVGIIFIGAGDAIQQSIEKKLYKQKTYEIQRTGNMMIAGCGFGVLGHLWYTFLDSKFPGHAVKTVMKKLLLEMVIGPPIFCGFFLGVGYLEGKSAADSIQEFKKNFLLICAADWVVYAPLQAINFLYLPPKFRFLYVSVLCLAYDVFLSYILHKESNKKLLLQKDG